MRITLLSLYEDKEEDDDDFVCGICGLPILSSPSYNCHAFACEYFLHQQCALKLPSTLIHSTHGPDIWGRHILRMMKNKGSPSSSYSNHTYKCEDCEFETHPLSAVVGGGGMEIKIKHRSHPAHELVAVCRESVSLCDACGIKQNGFFFTCNELCNFWIHQHCTTLPTLVTLHPHPQPYILTYFPPNHRHDELCQLCKLCRKPLPFRLTGVYFCPHSASFAHIACAINKRDMFRGATVAELVMLPDNERKEFPRNPHIR